MKKMEERIRNELYKCQKNKEEAQEAFDAYRFYHNHQRPHQALRNLPPISRYEFV